MLDVERLKEGGLQPGQLHPLIMEKRTTGVGYHVSCTEYASGEMELTAIKLTAEDSLTRGGGAKRKTDDKEKMEVPTLQKSQGRARRTVRKKCLSMNADRMLTLTFRENVTDIEEAWSCFKYFCKLMRWRYKDRFQYVAVPEYQKRGAVHFHLALSGFYHVNTVRRFWKRAVGHRDGNIDITSPRRHGKRSWNPKRIAQYLAKYITKNDSVDFNKRRYSSGGKIQTPPAVKGWLPSTELVHFIFDQVFEMRGKRIDLAWELEGYFGIIYRST